MKVIEPKEVIEEIYNLRTGEKYKKRCQGDHA